MPNPLTQLDQSDRDILKYVEHCNLIGDRPTFRQLQKLNPSGCRNGTGWVVYRIRRLVELGLLEEVWPGSDRRQIPTLIARLPGRDPFFGEEQC